MRSTGSGWHFAGVDVNTQNIGDIDFDQSADVTMTVDDNRRAKAGDSLDGGDCATGIW